MPRFTEEWMSNLLSKNNIVDVVSEYVSLTRKGSRYWGFCPFHNERNASFTVTPDREMFYCFSCKRGGGVVNFIMEHEHLDYMGAIAFLADRAGIPMPEFQNDDDWEKRKEYKKRLAGMMKEAARYFNANLKSEEGRVALEYANNRGLTNMISKYGLGYAKDSYDDLKNHLASRGYTVKEMSDAFLISNKNGKTYDIFRNRLIIPIINIAGDVIAFGGRIIGEGEPKYLNSSDTILFNKKLNLFGLNMVKTKKDLNSIILTEGYMDVISLYAGGVTNAVASLGTALTKEQAKLIKRYTNNVYISYDGDMPGLNAALRAIDILEKEELNVKVIIIPNDMDPDDFIRKYGKNGYAKLASKAKNGIEFKLYRLKMDYDINDADQLVSYATKASQLISKLKNEVQKERYIKFIAEETGISESTIAAQVKGETNTNDEFQIRASNLSETARESDDEAKLIALLLESPREANLIEIDEECFKKYGKLYSYIKNEVKKGILPNSAEILSGFAEKAESDEKENFAEIISVSLPEGTVNKTHYAQVLAVRIKIRSKQELMKQAQQDFNSYDADIRKSALLRIAELDKQIHSLQQELNRG